MPRVDRCASGGAVSKLGLQVYHGTVGRNGFLMLDFAPNQQGLIAPDQVARYAEFGTWIKTCYGSPLGTAAIAGPGPNASIAFAVRHFPARFPPF